MKADRSAHSGITRRTFLRRAGLAASLTALAQLRALPEAGAAATGDAAPDARPGFLSARETEILTQIADRMADTGDPGAPALRDTGAIATIDELLARLDPALSADVPLVLSLFEWGPLLFDFTPSRFTRMTDAQKDQSLRNWMTSRLGIRRLAFRALHNMAFVGYYAQEATWGLIGYQGPLLDQRKVS